MTFTVDNISVPIDITTFFLTINGLLFSAILFFLKKWFDDVNVMRAQHEEEINEIKNTHGFLTANIAEIKSDISEIKGAVNVVDLARLLKRFLERELDGK